MSHRLSSLFLTNHREPLSHFIIVIEMLSECLPDPQFFFTEESVELREILWISGGGLDTWRKQHVIMMARKGSLTSALYGRSEAQRVVNYTQKAHMRGKMKECEPKGRLDAHSAHRNCNPNRSTIGGCLCGRLATLMT